MKAALIRVRSQKPWPQVQNSCANEMHQPSQNHTMSASSSSTFFTNTTKYLIKYHRPIIISSLLAIPIITTCYVTPERINRVNRLCSRTRGEGLHDDATLPSTNNPFPLDENENSTIEYCLDDIFTLQNQLFKLRARRGETQQLQHTLEAIRERVDALESLLHHENQYERLNRHKAFSVLRNGLQCGSNASLYIPRNESPETKQKLRSILMDIQFKTLCIVRDMVMVPRYADTLINKGLLASIFTALYKKDSFDKRTRQVASDIIFQCSKHPETHSSFLRWNDLITEMAKKGDPLCHYTIACLLARMMNNPLLKETIRSYVELIDSAWIIFKRAQDTFTSSIAHKAFLLCSDSTSIDLSERESRIRFTDYFGLIMLTAGPIFGYSCIRHFSRHFSSKFLREWGIGVRPASRLTFYDIMDRVTVTTAYGLAFGLGLMFHTHYREQERNRPVESLPLGHQRSVLLYLSMITVFAMAGAYLYYRNYMTFVLMPYCYNLMVHELFPDNKVYVSRMRQRLLDWFRKPE